jgi:hypothetical protein
MRFDPKNTVAIQLLRLAQRPGGVTTNDFPDKRASDVGKICRQLMEAGYLTRLDGKKPYAHVCTQAQADRYTAAKNAPKPIVFAKPKPQRIQPVLSQPRPRPLPKQKDNRPTVYPVDAEGNPLWKYTVCPGFTNNPPKTNTFTGAY